MKEEIDKLNKRVDEVDLKFDSAIKQLVLKLSDMTASLQEFTGELKLDRKDYEISRKAAEKFEVEQKEQSKLIQKINEKLLVTENVQKDLKEYKKSNEDIRSKIFQALIVAFILGGVGLFAAVKGLS